MVRKRKTRPQRSLSSRPHLDGDGKEEGGRQRSRSGHHRAVKHRTDATNRADAAKAVLKACDSDSDDKSESPSVDAGVRTDEESEAARAQTQCCNENVPDDKEMPASSKAPSICTDEQLRDVEEELRQIRRRTVELRREAPGTADVSNAQTELKELQKAEEDLLKSADALKRKQREQRLEAVATDKTLLELDLDICERLSEEEEDKKQMAELRRRLALRYEKGEAQAEEKRLIQAKIEELCEASESAAGKLAEIDKQKLAIEASRTRLLQDHARCLQDAKTYKNLLLQLTRKEEECVVAIRVFQFVRAAAQKLADSRDTCSDNTQTQQSEVDLNESRAHDDTHGSNENTLAPTGGETEKLEPDPIEVWLRGLDGGRGSMLRYIEPLRDEFECLATLCAAVLPATTSNSVIGRIDPGVWEALGVTQLGHRMLIARGIVKLSDV